MSQARAPQTAGRKEESLLQIIVMDIRGKEKKLEKPCCWFISLYRTPSSYGMTQKWRGSEPPKRTTIDTFLTCDDYDKISCVT